MSHTASSKKRARMKHLAAKLQDPEHSSKLYLRRLLSTLTDFRQPDISRSAAAAYIASFLARAAFLPEQVLLEAIEQLARWCLQYCVSAESQPAAPRTPPGQGVLAVPPPHGIVHQVGYRIPCRLYRGYRIPSRLYRGYRIPSRLCRGYRIPSRLYQDIESPADSTGIQNPLPTLSTPCTYS